MKIEIEESTHFFEITLIPETMEDMNKFNRMNMIGRKATFTSEMWNSLDNTSKGYLSIRKNNKKSATIKM